MADLPDSDYEMEESEISHQLGELPDSLIIHILSFLPMRDVVSTTLISKRWKNLWTTIPCLNFIHCMDDDHYTKLRNFINRALIFWSGTKIQKFKIDFKPHFNMILSDDIDLWVRFAKKNEVEELSIHLAYDDASSDDSVYCAPQCIYSCSSLKILSLVGCELQFNGSVNWNQLKSLHIDSFGLGEHVINHVLTGCPQLEDFLLCLCDNNNNLNIQSNSLKILEVVEVLEFDPETDLELRILCPNLEILNLSGVFHRNCLRMDMSLLKDITLSYHGFNYSMLTLEKTFRDTLKKIFTAIQHVKRVTLSSKVFSHLQAMHREYLPFPLLSVESLELDLDYIELKEMVNVFGIFPKLKILVIKHFTWDYTSVVPLKFVSNVSKSFLQQLRKVEITSCLRGTSIFQFVEFLLEHARMLEKMVILPDSHISHSSETLLPVAQKLLSMPRSSPTAKLIFCRS